MRFQHKSGKSCHAGSSGMTVPLCYAVLWLCIAITSTHTHAQQGESDSQHSGQGMAQTIIAAALDLTRGTSSSARMEMIVHRPAWQRTSELIAWTRGREDALIRFTAPARDDGNATLKLGDQMWTFTPRLNRTIRLPFSMMSQSWAGSDFSYHDLSRTDKLLVHYTHRLLSQEEKDGHTIYRIESTPRDDAPVVWGKEVLQIRNDYVLLQHDFYDQDLQLVKTMQTLAIDDLGGRTMGTRMRITQQEKPDHWTELTYHQAQFDLDLPERLFTQFALRNAQADPR